MTELLEKYNPKNLNEAVEALDNLTKHFVDWVNWFEEDENTAISLVHHSLGQDIRNAWELWDEDSDLHKWFKERGIWHADDMSSIILLSFHREKNEKKWDIDKQIKFYKDFWKKNK